MNINKLIKLGKFLKDNNLNNESSQVHKLTKEAFSALFWAATCSFFACSGGKTHLNLIFYLTFEGNPWHGNGSVKVHSTLPGTIEKVTKKFDASQDNQKINSLLFNMNSEGYFDGNEVPSEYYEPNTIQTPENLNREYVLQNFKLSYYILRFENMYGGDFVDGTSAMYHDQNGTLLNNLEAKTNKDIIEEVAGYNSLYPQNAWMMNEVYVFGHSLRTYQISDALGQRSDRIFNQLKDHEQETFSFEAYDLE